MTFTSHSTNVCAVVALKYDIYIYTLFQPVKLKIFSILVLKNFMYLSVLDCDRRLALEKTRRLARLQDFILKLIVFNAKR